MSTRRQFLTAGVACSFTPLALADDEPRPAQKVVVVPRPTPPYRVWFQPRLFHRDTSLYAGMTVDASGWLDPTLARLCGVTALTWVYGLNHPEAMGPDYWAEECGEARRLFPRESPRLVAAGIAIDEWVPPAQPKNVEWLAQGLRAGRAANRDLFIAAWITDPTEPLFELVRDGTIDLVIIEGYTHSVDPALSTSWEGVLRRANACHDAGIEARTIVSFGHITDRKSHRGESLRGGWLRERCAELRSSYPAMPGVAFFQSDDPDTPELRELVRACDRLSTEFWPSKSD